MRLRVGIVGLGRVGGGVLRNNFSQVGGGRFDIRVVCDVMPIDHVAYLIAHDSSYGRPPFTVDIDDDDLLLDGIRVRYLRVDRRRSPPEKDSFGALREFELDVLFDATGTATINDFRALIVQNVAKKILCTWNVAGADISVVYGVNHQAYDPARHDVISASTCTGNAMVPICHILHNHFGIDYARIITIHPVLSDQKVLDAYHPNSQLGRACGVSIVPTPTNVGKSTSLVILELDGKLDSLSYRVPTAVVSVIDLTATLSTETSLEAVRECLEVYANGELNGIVCCEYGSWGHQKASIDYLGAPYSAIVLMEHLTLSNKRQLGMALMHDNEFAYCCRVLDVLQIIEAKNR